MFIVGFVIFSLYMVGYLTMVNKQHQIQKKQSESQKIDSMDFDGHGNWSRFPNSRTKKRKTSISKKVKL